MWSWRSGAAWSVLVSMLGVGGSLTAGVVIDAAQQHAAQDQLQRRAGAVTARVAAETRRYTDTVAMAAAALSWREALTAESFAEVAEPITRLRLPGVTSFAFLAPADTGEIAQVQQLWRTRGATGLVLKPAATGGEHFFAIFSQPLDGYTGQVTGVDASQSPAADSALRQARNRGDVVVSDAYHLTRDQYLPAGARQLSFVVVAPVLSPPAADGTREFRGWVRIGMRGQDFIGTALRESAQDLIDVGLTADTHTHTGTAQVAALRAPVTDARDLRYRSDVHVANKILGLQFAAARHRAGAAPATRCPAG